MGGLVDSVLKASGIGCEKLLIVSPATPCSNQQRPPPEKRGRRVCICGVGDEIRI